MFMNRFCTTAQKLLLACLLVLSASFGKAQTTLVAGDIAFTGYQGFGTSATVDEFSFVLLRAVTANTVVNFTDNGWLSTNVFRTGETTVSWTAATALPAGTEVKIVGLTPTLSGAGNPGTVTGTALSLSANGDQILAYQGSVGSPTFITAIHMNVYSTTNSDPVTTTAAAWDGTANTANSSALPTGLTNGTNAIWIGTQGDINSEKDNARFICAGDLSTVASIKGLIFDQTKWTTSDGDPSGLILPTGCSYITAAATPTIGTQPNSTTICAGANASFTITATGAVNYQWQVDNGGGFTNITNDVIYSGATTTTLNITAAPASFNNYQYRCVASNGSGPTNSNAAVLTVTPLPAGPTLLAKTPATATVADGTPVSATFNAGSGGTGCADDFRYTTNGGASYLPYTPGSNISTTGLAAGTGVVTIEGRRANCSAGCQGNYVALASWVVTPLPAGVTTLNAGDIAFSSYAAATDEFSFVLLRNIGPGTTVNFTNNGWLSTNVFRTGEESVTWSSNAAYGAGTEIKISGLTATLQSGGSAGTVTGTALSLNINGDQILAYRGSAAAPTFITAIHMNVYSTTAGDAVNTTAAAWDGTVNAVNASALPTGLTTGTNAIWIGTQGVPASEFDNSRYGNCAGPGTLGAINTLRAALNNQANWISNNNSPTPGFAIPTGCNYLGMSAPPNITGQPANASICAGADASFTVTATGAATYQWLVNAGSGFAPVTNDLINSGANTATLTITGAPFSYNGYIYQCLLTNGAGSTSSNTVTLTVNALPTNPSLASKTPAATNVADGTPVSATFIAGSGGTGCLDDFRYTTDGGATYLPYTPGSNISTTGLAGGSGWVFIEGRRAACTSSCQGVYTVLAAWYITPLPAAPTTLNAGDIAFSGYTSTTANSDFSFVLLRNVGAGTAINFTDNGWLSTNVFRTGETTVTWTAPAGGLTAGTEITIAGLTATKAGGGAAGTVTGTALGLSQIGDQILAYRGTAASPTFISAIHMNVYDVANGDPVTTTAAAWDGTANTASASALPTGLTTGVNAIWIGTQGVSTSEFMNARYGNCGAPGIAGPFTGLRTALNNQANWIRNNNTPPGFTLPVNCNYFNLQAPTITSSASFTPFTACAGSASAEQNFTVSGNNLTTGIVITAPIGFEVSTTSGSGFATSITLPQTGGSVANTAIYVRMAASATGTPAGNITLASTGVTTINAAVSGTVNPVPATPTITAAGPTTFCAGGSVVLTSSAATGNLWSTGATTQSITVGTSGTYTVTVTTAGCSSAPSAGTTVTVNPTPPTPTITPGGPTTFCAGGSVTLTSSSATGNLWSTGATTQSITVSIGGTYTVTVTSSGCSATSAGTTVTVNPLPATPTVTPGGPTTFCASGSVTLTSSSASGNVWSTGETTQSITVTTGGTYTVTVTSGGCTSAPSAGTTVTVNPIPATPTITAGGPTTFCTGGSVTLTSSSATGNLWSTGATTQSIIVSTAGTYTVTVTQTGCTSAPSAGTTVTVDPVPTTASAGPDATACVSPGTFTMAANVPTVGTGSWSQAPGGPATAIIFTVGSATSNIGGLTTAGTYTFVWTISSGTCAPSRDTMTITVNTNPAPFTLTGGGTFCPGTTTLTGPVDPNYTYTWQRSLTGISNPNSFTSFGGTASTQNITSSGNYRLIVTNQFGCSASDTTPVSMADFVFNGSLATGDATQTGRLNRFAVLSTCASPKACPGTFTTTGARLYDSYNITNPRSVPVCATIGLASGCGTSLFNVAYLGSFDPTALCTNYLADPGSSFPGTGYMEVTIPANATIVVVVHEVNTGTGCANYQLTVDVPRETGITVNPNTPVCSGTPVTLTAPIANSYSWNPGGNTTQAITVTPTATTKYFVTTGYGNVGCTTVDSATVIVDQLPTTAFAGNDTATCGLTINNLAANTPVVGTGTWTLVTGPGTVNFTNANAPNSGATVSVNGVYTLRWTIATGAPCINSSQDDILVNFAASPSVAIAGTDKTACVSPGSATMTATAPTTGTGVWTQVAGPSTAVIVNATSPTTNITNLAGIGTYTFRWTVTNAPCPATFDDVDVVVNGNPTPFILAGGGTFCPGTTTLTGPANPNYTYTWERSLSGIANPNSFTAIGGTAQTQAVTSSGNYRVIVTNQFGCTASDTASVSMADYVFNGSLATGDLQQNGRLNRFGVVSTCASPKACPGTFTTTGARLYDAYTITNPRNVPVCATIGIASGCGVNMFSIAYSGSYDPNSLCTNYLADPGSSFPNAGYYEATIPANGSIVVIVHEVNTGTGCANYQLTVDVPRDGAPIVVNPPSVTCASTATLTAPVANSYLWTPGGATTRSFTTPPLFVDTKYNVTLGYGNVGCTRLDSATVTVTSLPPTITCPANITANNTPGICGRAVTYTITSGGLPAPAITYAFTGATVASGSGDGSGSVFNVGVTTVTLTATNACGSVNCSFTVTINDNQAPTVTVGTIGSCYPTVAAAQAAAFAATSATDNCPGVLTETASTVGTCSAVVTVRTTDAAGNFTDVTYNTRIDNTAPTVTVGTIGSCYPTVAAAQAAALAATSATDNCPGALIEVASTVGTCSAVVTVTTTDGCGNATAVTYNTRIDNTAPVVTTGTISSCYPTVAAAEAAALAATSATDNCPGALIETASTVGTCSAVITVTTQDGCGNSTSITYNTRIDNTAPVVTTGTISSCYPTVAAAEAAALAATSATDNCPGALTEVASTVGTCSAVITVTTTDGCGNATAVTYNTRIDNTAPVVTTGTISSCFPTVAAAEAAALAATSATDNCPGALTEVASTVGTCSAVITVTTTDGCGNSTSITYNTRIDNTAPVVTVGTIGSCYPTVAAAEAAALAATSATDNCPGALTEVASTVGTCSAVITVTTTDGCGNATAVTYNTRIDNTPPTLTCPAPVTVSCVGEIPIVDITTVSNVTDNCPGIIAVTHQGDVISGQTCANRYTITRTYRATDGCGNFTECTQIITVDDQTPPTISCPADITVCGVGAVPAADITLVSGVSDNCGGVVTITHQGDVANGPSATAPYTITRTYRATDVCGNFTECTQTITVNPIPTVNVVADQVVCNTFNTAAINFTSPVAGTSYSWTNDNTAIGLAASGNGSTIVSFVATNTTNAPITATITVTPTANSCPGPVRTFTITVNPTPVANVVSNQTLCNGSATTAVSFSGPVAGTTYAWTNNTTSIGLGANGNGNIPSFTATNTTNAPVTATITVTPSANGCTGAPITFTITVNPTPTVDVVANQTLCNGSPTTAVNFSSPVSGTTYAWTNSNTAIGLAASGNGNIASFTATNTTNAPITATITVTPTANGCPGPVRTFTITVNPTPVANAVSNQIVCNNSPTTAVSFSGPVAGTTYSWTNNTTSIGLAASGNGDIPSFTATNTTNAPVTATITVTPSANGCPGAPITFTILVNPTPVVNAVLNQSLCNGIQTVPINFSGPVAGTTYSWTNNNTTIGLAASGNGNIAGFNATNAGATPVTATITVTPSANGCTGAPITFTITVNPTPVVTLAPLAPICGNAPAFTLTGGSPAGAGGIYFVNGVPQTSFNPANYAPGVHTVLYQFTNQFGCANTAVQNITVYPVPVSNFTINNSGQCLQNNQFVFTNTSTGAVSYVWNFGDATTSTATNPTKSYTAAGTYTVTLTATSVNGCVRTFSRTVTVYPQPVKPTVVPEFGNGIHSSIVENSYTWYLNGNAITPSNTQYFYPQTAGFYQVQVTTSFGCSTRSDSLYYIPEKNLTTGTDRQFAFVYPIPAKDDIINIHFNVATRSAVNFTLYTVKGQILLTGVIPVGTRNYKIDVRRYPSATYVLRMTDVDNMIRGVMIPMMR
jgi:large repetitive protein